MLKSGLIFGAVALVLVGITGAINFQLCAPCLALFMGAGAGYVAGMLDKPAGGTGASAKVGAAAGAIGGVGALFGHLGGGLVGALRIGPERAMSQAAELARTLGLSVPLTDVDPVSYYGSTLGFSCCFGLFEIALMAGLGALGGLLWYQMTGKNMAGGTPPMPGMPA